MQKISINIYMNTCSVVFEFRLKNLAENLKEKVLTKNLKL